MARTLSSREMRALDGIYNQGYRSIMASVLSPETAEDPYEYHETTSEVDQGGAVPPPGIGWQFVEKVEFDTITVYRWRRPCRLSNPDSAGAR